ncbi:hypothetical protein AKJ16_DCAP21415 [Drosera capensis]
MQGAKNFRSFKHAVKRLEEAAVSRRGLERTQLLRRWLALLKEVEKVFESSSEDSVKTLEQHLTPDEEKETTRKASLVLYYDSDEQSEPVNFLDVFLHSQALEGIVLSMILEPPNDEEVSLLLQMFELCLTGGKEVNNAVVSSIQDLSSAISSYEDEVLVKREELLQFAQGAISGLKVNADLARINAKAANLRKKLDAMRTSLKLSDDVPGKPSMETTISIEALKKAQAHIRTCSKLEELLLKRRLLHYGDTLEVHVQKVDKLKVLCESLANSSVKAEKRISDTRFQKEEALKFRASKESEVSEIEKEIASEIIGLEQQRDVLEAELKKVNISLAAAHKRLQNTREERDQFEEVKSQIVAHLETKEDELSKSVGSCRVEADVLKTWINFLEDTWNLQCSYAQVKEKGASDELETHEEYFVKLTIDLLSGYKRELEPSIARIRIFMENLKALSDVPNIESKEGDENIQLLNPRKNLEEEYLEYEEKIIATFGVVDNLKEQFYTQQGKIPRNNDATVKGLFDDIKNLRQKFEAVERPILEMESPTVAGVVPVSDKLVESSSASLTPEAKVSDLSKIGNEEKEQKEKKEEREEHVATSAANIEVLDHEADLAKLESEFGKVSPSYSAAEISGWEFDELERELNSGDPSTST